MSINRQFNKAIHDLISFGSSRKWRGVAWRELWWRKSTAGLEAVLSKEQPYRSRVCLSDGCTLYLFGDLGNDILTGDRGADYFVFNNDAFGTGVDTITDFAGDDRILTTTELSSTNGIVDLGSDNDLDLFDGGSVTINDGSVDHLIVLGTVQIDGATYYSYGLVG